MLFGKKLKQLLRSRGLTQKQPAAAIFVSRSAIAVLLVYPPISGKSGTCRIRKALYRFGAFLV